MTKRILVLVVCMFFRVIVHAQDAEKTKINFHVFIDSLIKAHSKEDSINRYIYFTATINAAKPQNSIKLSHPVAPNLVADYSPPIDTVLLFQKGSLLYLFEKYPHRKIFPIKIDSPLSTASSFLIIKASDKKPNCPCNTATIGNHLLSKRILVSGAIALSLIPVVYILVVLLIAFLKKETGKEFYKAFYAVTGKHYNRSGGFAYLVEHRDNNRRLEDLEEFWAKLSNKADDNNSFVSKS